MHVGVPLKLILCNYSGLCNPALHHKPTAQATRYWTRRFKLFQKTGFDVYLGAPLNVFFAPLFWILIFHCPENGCKGDEALDLHLIIRMHLKRSSLPLPKLAARIRIRQTIEALKLQTAKKEGPGRGSFHDVAIARLRTIQQSTHAPTPSSFQTPNKGLNRQNPASTPFAQRELLSASVECWGSGLQVQTWAYSGTELKLSYCRGLIDPKSLKLGALPKVRPCGASLGV